MIKQHRFERPSLRKFFLAEFSILVMRHFDRHFRRLQKAARHADVRRYVVKSGALSRGGSLELPERLVSSD
jgi:hypothetical protein